MATTNGDNNNSNNNDFWATTLSIVGIGAAMLSFNPTIASASLPPPPTLPTTTTTTTTTTSSLMVATEIKILDMSLPSYGDISTPKADLDVLKLDPPKSAVPGIIVNKKDSSSTKSSSTKSSSKKKERQVQKEKVDDENDKGPKLEIVDMSLPSYDESTVGKGKEAFLF